MKQTPIPEKIEIPRALSTHAWDYYTAAAINSLIDVLTEQREINEKIDRRIQMVEHYLGLHEADCKCLWKKPNTNQPYTAMRSTGCKYFCHTCEADNCMICDCRKSIKPKEYCECKDRSISGGICSICHKSIKLQEDVRKDIYNIGFGFYKNNDTK